MCFAFREYTLRKKENSDWWNVYNIDGETEATLINKEEARRYIWLQYSDVEYLEDSDLIKIN